MQLRAAAMLAFTLVELEPAGLAQQLPQNQVDCESARNDGDPRCQVLMRPPSQGSREDLAMPNIPVIRDRETAIPQYDTRFERGRFGDQQISDSRAPLAPEEPTEFQRFVERAVGRLLPVFGQNLFERVPSTFAPADRVPVTPEYLVGPGDQLLVRGWGQIDLNVSPVVDRSGAVYIPQVGQLNVAGLKFAQVQDYLKTAVSRVYRNFDLSVNMGQLRSMQVFVVGHARRPGVYTVSSLSTLVNAVFASGGPDAHGSMRNIRLTRLNRVVAELDLYDLLLDGNKSGDRPLLPGDVIYIPPVGPQVALTGSVNTPALYELKESSTLKEALQLAGGLTPVAVKQQAVVERIGGSGRSVLQVPLEGDGAGETVLRNGDIVNVLAIVPRYDKAVTLRGNVADPIRMPWRSGMRVRDLIPDRQALLSREYWSARNLLTIPELRPEADRNIKLASDTPLPGRTDEFAAERGTDQNGGNLRNTNSAYMLPDSPTSTSLSALRTGSRVVAPGSIAATKSDSAAATHRVRRNQLEVNWSYAVIERQDQKDLRTTLIPFNLGKAILDGDEAENVPLEPGDIVNVFSIADLKVPQELQTRYVRLEGEFGAAGVYSVRPRRNTASAGRARGRSHSAGVSVRLGILARVEPHRTAATAR